MRTFVSAVSSAALILFSTSSCSPPETKAQSDIFRPDIACHSPHGDVESNCQANSPDGTRYAKEVEPFKNGNIGIFDRKNGQRLKTIKINEKNNPLKGLAWAPDGRRLAVMYHHGDGGYVEIVDTHSGSGLRQVDIKKWYHFMAFSEGDKQLSLSVDGRNLETIDLSRN